MRRLRSFLLVLPVAHVLGSARANATPPPEAVSPAPIGSATSSPPPSQDAKSVAGALFDEGKRLMDARKYADACPKFRESLRLAPGGGTQLALAMCLEASGKHASAWTEYKLALAMAARDGRSDRSTEARTRIAELEPKLSRVVVRVPDAARIASLSVKLDDAVLPPAAWDVPIPVDPGTHTVSAEAPGQRPWSTTFVVRDPAERHAVSVSGIVADDPSTGRRTAALILGASGGAAVGVGAYFGFRAVSKRKEADRGCDDRTCTSEGFELNEQARKSALIADVAIGAGVAALAVGAYLYLTAPTPRRGDDTPRSPTTALRFVPLVAPGTLGASVSAGW